LALIPITRDVFLREALSERIENLALPVTSGATALARRLWRILPFESRVRIIGVVTAGLYRVAPRLRRLSVRLERDYPAWIARHDTLADADIAAIRTRIGGMTARPVISLLMPVFNPPPGLLRAAIASVRAQLYPDWELRVRDDAASDPAVVAVLDQAAAEDERIRLVRRVARGEVAAACNDALAGATGGFVAVLDPRDELPRHALYEVAAALVAHPDTDILYTDEDRLDAAGRRHEPTFKTGWNPDLMLGRNAMGRLAVYRRDLLDRIGGFRVGLEGAHDHDLALRAAARTPAARIRHLPAILYHGRRAAADSRRGDVTGRNRKRDPGRCAQAARMAVTDFLRQSGVSGARVEPAPGAPGLTRVVFPVPDPPPLVSVIIPTRDHADLLRGCLEGLLHRTRYTNLEVLIVDNDSVEPATLALFDEARRDERVRVMRFPGPFNYSRMNNEAVRAARGELILLLNNDIEVIGPDWLDEMVSHAVRPEIGAVGAKLLFRNDLVQHGGVLVGMGGVAGHLSLLMADDDPGYRDHLLLTRNILAVTAACMLVRRSLFLEAGGLNEEGLPINYNDIDLCLKIVERGYRNLWTPHAKLYHLESASRGHNLTGETLVKWERERAWMRQRWGNLLRDNPDANPNLILEHPHYRLAFPPRRRPPWRDGAFDD
jgi:GT2 family glycosyltransferase